MLNKIILAISLLGLTSCWVAFYKLSQPDIGATTVSNSAIFEAGYQATKELQKEITFDNTVRLITGDNIPSSDENTLVSPDSLLSLMNYFPDNVNEAIFGKGMNLYHRGYTTNDVNCLAKNIYFEARNQKELGQVVVGLVVLSRNKASGRSICQVVKRKSYAKSSGRVVCQFSWVCEDGHKVNLKNSLERDAWHSSVDISQDILLGKYRKLVKTQFHDVLNYHTKKVSPKWSRKMVVVATIGDHIFYRPKNG